MKATRQVLDGLWHCLCPSFGPSIRSVKDVKGPIAPFWKYRLPDVRTRTFVISTPQFDYGYAQSDIDWIEARNASKQYKHVPDGIDRTNIEETRLVAPQPRKPSVLGVRNGKVTKPRSPPHRKPLDQKPAFIRSSKLEDKAQRYNPPVNYKGLRDEGQSPELVQLSTEELYGKLRYAASRGQNEEVGKLIKILVADRHEQPNQQLYAAVILVNVDPETGSAATIAKQLEEMKAEGINANAAIYFGVLKVLAVHPDYILRNKVLEEMRERWITLTSDGSHYVIAGLLRERHFEIAFEKLEQLEAEGIRIYGWLYELFVYMLCQAEEVDAALKLMQQRVARGEISIPSTTWYFLLDTASRCLHYEAVHYVWKKRVETMYLNPASGLCLNILNTASRHGDAHLATDVFRILGNRSSVFSPAHYEALLEAYVPSGDIKTSLTILCMMREAKLEPEATSTRALYQGLKNRPETPREALETLRTLHKDGREIPVAAVNVIIEATVSLNDLPKAIEHYKTLHTLCSEGPNTATFNVLLRGCRMAKRKDLAMFLASEMVALNIRPDALTYDRLVLVCLREDDYEDAFEYYYEMKSQGWRPRQGTLVAMIQKCLANGDKRIDSLKEEAEGKRGDWRGQ